MKRIKIDRLMFLYSAFKSLYGRFLMEFHLCLKAVKNTYKLLTFISEKSNWPFRPIILQINIGLPVQSGLAENTGHLQRHKHFTELSAPKSVTKGLAPGNCYLNSHGLLETTDTQSLDCVKLLTLESSLIL